ncbi:MAG: translation elongation factor Ts [Candidatus Eutrophobiaceae bacterium]
MQISPEQIRELRGRTGAGIMDCKKALQESNGDLELAIEHMRKSGMAQAERKSGRAAAEGRILIREGDGSSLVMEINSETDFVARDENFRTFSEQAADAAMTSGAEDVDALLAEKVDGQSVEELRQVLVSRIGENIVIRRFQRILTANLISSGYLHGDRIGVVVTLKGGSTDLAKDIAMHIAASNPMALSEEDLPDGILEKERDICREQQHETDRQSGKPKPPDIVEKIITGKVRKFMEENTLLGQKFVKDPDGKLRVGQLLRKEGAEVVAFLRYGLGEGLEKRSDNFTAEVMAQARGS